MNTKSTLLKYEKILDNGTKNDKLRSLSFDICNLELTTFALIFLPGFMT